MCQHPEDDLRHAFIEALLLSMSVKHARQSLIDDRLPRTNMQVFEVSDRCLRISINE